MMMKMEWVANRWTCVAAAIWIQWSCGASYTFSIYSPVLKSTQGYDQSTLDTVSVFKDIGANFGILSGLLYSAVAPYTDSRSGSPSKSKWTSLGGPWVVIAAGAVQCFVGFMFIWASVVGLIDPPPVPVMCFFAWLGSNGQTFLNTTNVVTGLRNFPDYSGTIIGIMKGFVGLSGAILIQLYHTFCDGDPTTYLLMLACLPAFICILLMFLSRIYEVDDGDYKKHLNSFSVVTVIIVAYLMFIILLQNFVSLPYWGRLFIFVILMVLLALPFGIAIKAQLEESQKFSQTYSIQRVSATNDGKLITSSSHAPSGDQMEYQELPSDEGQVQVASADDGMLPHEVEMNLLQAMCTVDFWMLFVTMISGLGSGLATINNMSQIGQSLGYSTIEINNLVSLWSMWNFLGRFGGGHVSDYIMHKKGWPRPLLMTATLGIMIIGHVIIATGFRGNLYLGPVLVGICYGANWSLMPTITSEIFGVKHMGTIFNTIAASSPLGSYILSVRVVGYIYDKEASEEDNSCIGVHCFMSSFLILAGVAFLAFLFGLALFFRTQRFYKQVVIRRLKHYAR
ncbi:protein NUCLEAR FUSION DEFECTIVE 4-like [Gastrolobium bilobum]|uniref:protein NUCLEAR FUSION DEFECTIVE 4-like n=1 Tax=Gastrolobium bilobum TaxID=150636 RepID=UPI002AAF4F04|nr:protein NUCLEAR FUSION DEFECTIVE 4-like [Gastrolobium bilobum]XP_061373497.1 protein NUCLEAR FUSION DEFECTIVE 4-like [Gastrolobium bilobum]